MTHFSRRISEKSVLSTLLLQFHSFHFQWCVKDSSGIFFSLSKALKHELYAELQQGTQPIPKSCYPCSRSPSMPSCSQCRQAQQQCLQGCCSSSGCRAPGIPAAVQELRTGRSPRSLPAAAAALKRSPSSGVSALKSSCTAKRPRGCSEPSPGLRLSPARPWVREGWDADHPESHQRENYNH